MKLNSHLQIENLESLIKTSELNLLIKSQEFEIQSIDNNALSLTIQELSRANKELDIQTACKTSFEDALLLAIIESTNERLLLEAAIADSYIEKKELETRVILKHHFI